MLSSAAALPLLIILFLTTILTSNSAPFGSEKSTDHALNSFKCTYLKTEDHHQHNAFSIHKHLCCMCPKGHRYAGICNLSHPNTTQCEPCENDEYIDFEPHLVEKCYHKKTKLCVPPMVFYLGTTSEPPSCVCPAGTKKNGKQCVPVQILNATAATNTMPNTTSSTMSTTTKRIFTDDQNGNADTSTTMKATLAVRNTSAPSISKGMHDPDFEHHTTQQSVRSSADPTESTTASDKDREDTGGGNLAIIVPCVVAALLVIALILILLGLWKCGVGPFQRSSTQTTNKDNTSADPTPDSSSTALVGHETRERRDVHNNAQHERLLVESQGLEVTVSAAPTQILNDTVGLRYSPRNNRVDQAHLGQPEEPQHRRLSRNERERNKKFVKEVARKFGEKDFPKKEAMPLVRDILDDQDIDEELKSIYKKHEYDHKEMLYEFLSLAMQRKGSCLTPNYLLEKVKNTGLQTFVEIVQDEMKEPYMRIEVCNT